MSASAEERLARLEEAINGMGRELRDIKTRLDRGDELMATIHTLTAQNKQILEELKEHGERIKAVEEKPAKRWDALIGAGIAAVVGAVVGWLARS